MSSVIDLTPTQRRTILRLIENHLPNTDVWAYGSRVQWTSRPSSDLDLVAFAGPEQRRQVADLREAFEESNLPFRVDLLVWDDIPESFREQIDAVHVALVEWAPGAQSWCGLEIAHILGALDDKIELNRRMCDTLEAMVWAIYKDWFVDFGPVRAKMEGRETGLPPSVAALFPDRLVDSRTDLGEIPEQWSVGALGDVACSVRHGVSPEDVMAETLYIGPRHMPRRSVALADWGRAEDVLGDTLSFRQGDILFGKLRPHFQKVWIAPADGICSTDIVVVRPHTDLLFPFAVAVASSSAFVAHNARASTGTKMPRTNWETLSGYPCVMPPMRILEAFRSLTAPGLRHIVSAVRESLALRSVRDTLLPKLPSGRIGASLPVQRRAR